MLLMLLPLLLLPLMLLLLLPEGMRYGQRVK
jgi:hypothetical protein